MNTLAIQTPLWLLTAFTLTTQELVKLSVTPKVTAECGEQVTLNCNASSSQHGLSIKHMKWFQNNTSFCSVDSEGRIKTHTHAQSDFYCEYKHGQLSLIFKGVQPLESGNSKRYMCKLQSNQGVSHAETRLALQECCGIVQGVLNGDRPSCTFQKVYPDGDVHWFHGSVNLTEGPVRHHTTKHVDKEGWVTIHSYLEQKSSDVPFNCSLKSTASGRYIASTLVQNPVTLIRVNKRPEEQRHNACNGVGSQGPMWAFFCILILLAVHTEIMDLPK